MRPKYEDHVETLRAAAGRVAKSGSLQLRRQDLEEAVNQAYLVYVEAARDWDRRRTNSFEQFLSFRLRRLYTTQRKAAWRSHLLPRDWGFDLGAVAAPPLVDPLADLSDDAAALARLALASRPDMTPDRIRAAMRAYYEAVGWSRERFAAAFQEVAEALQ